MSRGQAAPPQETLPAAVHFLVGWTEPGGSARGGGAAGQSPPGARGISWLAGADRGPGSGCSAASSRVAGRLGGRDNVAGLVAGRRPLSSLKWVPRGCCLAGDWGTGEEGEAVPGRVGAARGGPNPSFL